MSRQEVIASKQYLSATGHWPKIPARANPERWLNGFQLADMEHAVALLESLVYFSMEQTTKLATSLFHSLSEEVSSGSTRYNDRRDTWVRFLNECVITFPTGEIPNPTDSGHTFARMARQELNIEEDRFLYPEGVVEALHRGERKPIVMVDDFAGSGDQFLKTWRRLYVMFDGTKQSLATMHSATPVDLYYIPAVATEYAVGRILRGAPDIKLRTAHTLTKHYSAVDPDSSVFPDSLRHSAAAFVSRASQQAGIKTEAELGWHKLALAIAFEHSVPDATLPILWADTPTWNSLLRRS